MPGKWTREQRRKFSETMARKRNGGVADGADSAAAPPAAPAPVPSLEFSRLVEHLSLAELVALQADPVVKKRLAVHLRGLLRLLEDETSA
jgi:hypothetical protein